MERTNNMYRRDSSAPHNESNAKALAMAYIVVQPPLANVYNSGDALRRGTLFPELDKPFLRYGGSANG